MFFLISNLAAPGCRAADRTCRPDSRTDMVPKKEDLVDRTSGRANQHFLAPNMGSKSLSSTLENPPPELNIASPFKKRKAQEDTGEHDARPETKEKRKKKSKERKEGPDDEAATPGVGVDEEVQTKKAKKHKKKHDGDMELIVSQMSEGVDGEGTVQEGRSKETQGSDRGEGSDCAKRQRKKRDKEDPVSEDAVLPEGERKSDKAKKPKEKKTKVGKDDTVLTDTDHAVAIGKEKKEKREKKKRPRNDKDGGEDDPQEGKKKKTRLAVSQDAEYGTETSVKKSSKKRRKGEPTDLPDPEEDESLSEQARKGVHFFCSSLGGFSFLSRKSLPQLCLMHSSNSSILRAGNSTKPVRIGSSAICGLKLPSVTSFLSPLKCTDTLMHVDP